MSDPLANLSDQELLHYFRLFRECPPGRAKRLAELRAGAPPAPIVSDLLGPVHVPPQSPPTLEASRVFWNDSEPDKRHRPPAGMWKRAVESDRGEWWPTPAAAAAVLGVKPQTVAIGVYGYRTIKGRKLQWSKQNRDAA